MRSILALMSATSARSDSEPSPPSTTDAILVNMLILAAPFAYSRRSDSGYRDACTS